MLVVLDTNVWVSAVINASGHPAYIIAAWRANRFDVVISVPLLMELASVLNRPRIRSRYPITDRDVLKLFGQIHKQAIQVSIDEPKELCRDPRDNVVLETAIVGGAMYIVSRDEDITRSPDLMRHLESHGIRAVTVRRFLQEINWP